MGIELAGTQPRQASHFNEPTSGRIRRRRSDWVHKAKLILSQNDLILALDQLTGTVELVYDYSLRPSRASPVSSSPTVTAVIAHNQKPSLLSSAAAAIQRPLSCVLANRLQLAETTDVTCWLRTCTLQLQSHGWARASVDSLIKMDSRGNNGKSHYLWDWREIHPQNVTLNFYNPAITMNEMLTSELPKFIAITIIVNVSYCVLVIPRKCQGNINRNFITMKWWWHLRYTLE